MAPTATELVLNHLMNACHAPQACTVPLVGYRHQRVPAELVMSVITLLVYLHQFSLMKWHLVIFVILVITAPRGQDSIDPAQLAHTLVPKD